jgi:hypothetical protein
MKNKMTKGEIGMNDKIQDNKKGMKAKTKDPKKK